MRKVKTSIHVWHVEMTDRPEASEPDARPYRLLKVEQPPAGIEPVPVRHRGGILHMVHEASVAVATMAGLRHQREY